MNCTLNRPDRASDFMIMYNLIENYELPLIYEWRCFTHFGQDFKALRRNQILKCIGKDLRLPTMFQNPIKSIAYRILHREMSTTFVENYLRSLELENYYSFLLQYHFEKKSHNNVNTYTDYYSYWLLMTDAIYFNFYIRGKLLQKEQFQILYRI